MKDRIVLIALGVTLVMLSVIDIVATFHIVDGGGYELNQVMAQVIALGFWPALALKAGAMSALAAYLVIKKRLSILAVAVAVYAGICLWNVSWI
jgi:hypothetical protein